MNPTLEFSGSPPYTPFIFEKTNENTDELQFITSLSTVFLYLSCESLQSYCEAILSTVTNGTYVWVIDCTDVVDSTTDICCILYIANWAATKYKCHLTQVCFQYPPRLIHTLLYTYWHELSEDLQQIIVIADYNS
jgi:hypothetical protein